MPLTLSDRLRLPIAFTASVSVPFSTPHLDLPPSLPPHRGPGRSPRTSWARAQAPRSPSWRALGAAGEA
eukprot:4407769-Pleurochrysis_carterae.AAC.1